VSILIKKYKFIKKKLLFFLKKRRKKKRKEKKAANIGWLRATPGHSGGRVPPHAASGVAIGPPLEDIGVAHLATFFFFEFFLNFFF
jgi:hypothetical protein